MPYSNPLPEREAIRDAIFVGRKLAGMLQATMGLEGQGLDRASLRAIKRKMIVRLMEASTSSNPALVRPGATSD